MKSIHFLLNMPWQNKKNWAHGFLKDSSENIIENHSLLIKSAVKTNRKPNPLLFERGQWQHVENHIHCLVKQQWQHMEILPLLTKFALTAQEKLHPLMFERKQWQHVENPIHCLVHYSDKMENHPLLSARALATCGKPHPLLSETAVTTYGKPSTAY